MPLDHFTVECVGDTSSANISNSSIYQYWKKKKKGFGALANSTIEKSNMLCHRWLPSLRYINIHYINIY